MACERQLQNNQGSSQMLPRVVATEQQSLVVVKKLLAIAVSSITYLRGLFPEKAYGSKYIEEQKVMILREQRTCPGASQIVQWLQGCFDALQKRYLRLILLSIYSDPEFPQKVTECYQFRIQYTEKGPRLDFESKNQKRVTKMDCNDIKKASILLVRKLYTLMQNLGPLPDSVCLNMKLSYYDEVTPEDYQPVGFKEGNNSTLVFEKEPVNLTMGEVVTPFHTLKVDVTTEKERLEQVDDDEPVYSRDKWALKINEEEIVSVQNIQQEIAFKGKVVRDTGIENSDLSKSEMLDDSQAIQVDSVVKSKTALDVATKTTRSRRAFKSMDKKSGAEVPSTNKNMFEFPTSQDLQPTPLKRRKFSVPKDSR
ncbi:HORMA domain-containing protein 1 [Astyanax mexicanus]|uniref:HORMA domain containing 1 n=1 Tax=Astyanax mexicanus TaxID=7994 RepID=A0A3B1KDS9_ASTMX|nr:HORMA domain-containing protein 1 [Astyanax mexicanus]XP_022529235.1 HORMA domain-containing protein 1 [Astyanax mexicanus]XP_022529236.1 HORMA domain-containing protein 1 [Astyanax mexicanus]XP_022529237.1 HORMA domain-containing protein 1 [Astyanax mexicanus]